LGVIASRARRVTDAMFFTAARTLAATVSDQDVSQGSLFPPLGRIREISLAIAVAVARCAYESNLASSPRPPDLEAAVRRVIYNPSYEGVR
jgi:malate dehydrogenase (oxaloacetate-decarboxylating)(NADP+)